MKLPKVFKILGNTLGILPREFPKIFEEASEISKESQVGERRERERGHRGGNRSNASTSRKTHARSKREVGEFDLDTSAHAVSRQRVCTTGRRRGRGDNRSVVETAGIAVAACQDEETVTAVVLVGAAADGAVPPLPETTTELTTVPAALFPTGAPTALLGLASS